MIAFYFKVELYKEVKKNGSQRCVRAAMTRFSQLAKHIRPSKCRAYLVNLLPCLESLALRPEEQIHECLAQSFPSLFSVLGPHTNNNEVRLAKDYCKVLDPSQSIKSIREAVSQKVAQQEGFYSCKDCGFKNGEKGNVVDHAEIHLDHPGYECKLCGKSQKTWNAFKCHFNRFHS